MFVLVLTITQKNDKARTQQKRLYCTLYVAEQAKVNKLYNSIWKPFSLSLETLVVLAVVHGLQDQHVELFRVAAGTVAPWREALLVTLVRFLVMSMMLVMFAAAATVPQPSGATPLLSLEIALALLLLLKSPSASAAEVARLKVGRRARDRGLDRVVRIVPDRGGDGPLDRVALQDEAKVVPLVVQAGQLLVEVVRQRQAERHLEPAAGRRTLRSGRGRDDGEGRRRRETVQHPVGFTSAAGADLAVSVP